MKTFLKIMVALFMLSGCAGSTTHVTQGDTVSVRTKVPVIPELPRPNLDAMTPDELAAYQTLPPAVRAKLEANNSKLMEYAEGEHVAIHDYNAFAAYSNQLSDSASAATTKEPKP